MGCCQRVKPKTNQREYDQRPGENVSIPCASGDSGAFECTCTECGGKVPGVGPYTIDIVMDEGTGEEYEQLTWSFEDT